MNFSLISVYVDPFFKRSLVAPCKVIQQILGFWIPRRGFQIPATGFQSFSVKLGFWIPVFSGIADSFGCIPDSKAQDSGSHEQTFPCFLNPDSLSSGNPCLLS